MFFLLALAMQSVLGMSAIETGIAFVPMGVTAIAGATLAPIVVARFGTRVTFAIGALLGTLSLGFLSQMDASVSYAAHVLPAIMVYGFAIPFMGVPNTIAAIRDVPAERAGTASGLVNASFQVGGAIGVAAVRRWRPPTPPRCWPAARARRRRSRAATPAASRRRPSSPGLGSGARARREPRPCASMPRRASRQRPTWSRWPPSHRVWQSPAP